jgi:hypothetical protein
MGLLNNFSDDLLNLIRSAAQRNTGTQMPIPALAIRTMCLRGYRNGSNDFR